MRNNKTIEILSPAKNFEYAKQAILCGADAVYMGAPIFSLRHEHGNSLEDIKKTVEFAHKYWAKVYVPLNCLLYSKDDLDKAQELINELYRIEIDGLIIQDIGILELDIPPIPLILSTNTMCYTKEDAQFFEECGVDRIVLPRELNYKEIESIANNSTIPLEIFCYGFLCVGHSGNCYLAYVENLAKSKSSKIAHYQASNHGVCPERCMGNWTLKDSNGNILRENDRLFNLRFLDLSKEIEKLFELGIDSYKIAGREKDLKHVKNATAYYSNIANELVKKKNIKRQSSGRSILGFEPDLNKNFNKGFTDFFLNGRKKEMYSKFDLVGQYVGTIINFNNNNFELDSQFQLNKGDRLRYKLENQKVNTLEIIDIKDNKYYINPQTENLNNLDLENIELYRYIDKKGFDEVENSINYRIIKTKLTITKECNPTQQTQNQTKEFYKLTATDEDNNTIELVINCSNTINTKKNTNNLKEIFYNLDVDCEFLIDEINCSEDYINFNQSIESIRELIFDKLRQERKLHRPKNKSKLQKNNHPYYKKELTYLNNATNEKTQEFYERHQVEKIETALENLDDVKGKKVFTSSYCLRYELGYCTKQNPDKTPNLPWYLEQLESGVKYKADFNCKDCRMYLYIDEK